MSSTDQAAQTRAGRSEPRKEPSEGRSESLVGVLEGFLAKTDGDEVTIGELIATLDRRSYGPLLLLPALIAVLPTGAIPGMSILTGTLIILVAAQLLWGRDTPWVPSRVADAALPRDVVKSSVERGLPWARWVESYLRRRWTQVVEPPAHRIVAAVCIALALTMFPLALLPFAVAVPGISILLFALGLMMGDGLLVAIGYGLGAIAVGLVVWAA